MYSPRTVDDNRSMKGVDAMFVVLLNLAWDGALHVARALGLG